MRHLLTALLALGWLLQPAAAAPGPAELAAHYARTVDRRLAPPPAEVQSYAALLRRELQGAGITLEQPQYLVLVDRSPQVQALLLFWLAPDSELLIGAAPVSTGRTGEYDYFETPTGVYAHTPAVPDFRAEGSYNEFGIRGFGLQGTRVFDFGWQSGRRGWGAGGTSAMRLLLHATDPDRLEPLLGSVESKGCIRIPASLIQLLDQYGLLDADYEEAVRAGRRFWVLSPQRTPVPDAGRYLVIVDSGRSERPEWSPRPPALRRATPP
jgi:hypothetical protein